VGVIEEDQQRESLTHVKARLAGACETHLMQEKPLIEPGAEKILSLADETGFAANGIVSRTVFRSPGCRMVLFGFAEGQELSEHTSTRHALVQILSGECEFTLAGKPHPLKAGDLLYMPPHLPHAASATKPFSMLLTLTPESIPAEHPGCADARSPSRFDFNYDHAH
jgi:quercetin dioxygenase-like cupin family protein